jgi:hypothetical protein
MQCGEKLPMAVEPIYRYIAHGASQAVVYRNHETMPEYN